MGTETHSALDRPFTTLRVLGALALLVVALILAAVPANAQTPDADSDESTTIDTAIDIAQGSATGFVDVVEVNGLIDPVMVNFINRSLDESAANDALAVVLQMESEGAAVDDAEITALATLSLIHISEPTRPY